MGVKRVGGRRYANLCGDLYLLSLQGVPGDGPVRGSCWEAMVADVLAANGYPARAVPGGVSVHGMTPASGLRHQIDGEIVCVDALVVGEWKAYRGSVPKNEVLRFKAVTDDLFDGMGTRRPRIPILRLFGVAGDASRQLRWYAARHGIALIERSRWPAPVLADPYLQWSVGDEPTQHELRRLRWLWRPLQAVYLPGPNGASLLPPPLPSEAIEAMLRTQDDLSHRLWAQVDRSSDALFGPEAELGLAA